MFKLYKKNTLESVLYSETNPNLSFTKMHPTQQQCVLGKAVRNVKSSKSQFGQKIQVTHKSY